MRIRPVIMAGGVGSRLFPLSTSDYPKQFLKIFHGVSSFQLCIIRNLEFGTPIVITNIRYRNIVAKQLQEIEISANVILEPLAKGTLTCAILSSIIIKNSKDCILLLPADHYIEKSNKYLESIKFAINYVDKKKFITLGIVPMFATSKYGYINLGKNINKNTFEVRKFIEKPNFSKAYEYTKSKEFLWNSGIFILSRSCILSLVKLHEKEAFYAIKSAWVAKKTEELNFVILPKTHYNKIEYKTIDYALLEKINNSDIIAIKADFGWKDLGDWAGLVETLRHFN